jgi:hypothetical protein
MEQGNDIKAQTTKLKKKGINMKSKHIRSVKPLTPGQCARVLAAAEGEIGREGIIGGGLEAARVGAEGRGGSKYTDLPTSGRPIPCTIMTYCWSLPRFGMIWALDQKSLAKYTNKRYR